MSRLNGWVSVQDDRDHPRGPRTRGVARRPSPPAVVLRTLLVAAGSSPEKGFGELYDRAGGDRSEVQASAARDATQRLCASTRASTSDACSASSTSASWRINERSRSDGWSATRALRTGARRGSRAGRWRRSRHRAPRRSHRGSQPAAVVVIESATTVATGRTDYSATRPATANTTRAWPCRATLSIPLSRWTASPITQIAAAMTSTPSAATITSKSGRP